MFELRNYEREIRDYATNKKVSNSEAVSTFIYNLVIMRPHFEGFDPEVNFRALGQQWNKLPSDVRVAQKAEVLKLLDGAPIASRRATSK